MLQLSKSWGSITTSVLAAANLESWTALVVSISAALGSWQEFIRVGEKLERYATIIQRLSSLMLWWQSLPDVDKANSRNIQILVESGEGAVAEEHSAWLSDARATKKVLQAMHGSKSKPAELQRVEVKRWDFGQQRQKFLGNVNVVFRQPKLFWIMSNLSYSMFGTWNYNRSEGDKMYSNDDST